MLYSYDECIKKYKSLYYIKKAIKSNQLFKIQKGIYSDTAHPKELEIILKKYHRGIFSSRSAFYFHGITDVIPDDYYLATDRNDTKINDSRVVQIFVPSNLLNLGKIEMNYKGIVIPIYNKERMLIEAVRYKDKLPFDYYKEIIEYYRNHKRNLDVEKLQDYIDCFPKANKIDEIIQMEVF